MKTLQLHLVLPPPAEPKQVDDTELAVQAWWLEEVKVAGALDLVGRYAGELRIPAVLLQQLQQATPLMESILPDAVRIAWTGVALPELPPDKLIPKLAKVLRGLKRLWGDKDG